MERPQEIRQAFRAVTAYVERLERDLATERKARQLLELKLKAAQAAAAPREASAPPTAVAAPSSRAAALALLGLSGRPGAEVIRQAYRRLARELHPDAPGGSAEQFLRLQEALETLLPAAS